VGAFQGEGGVVRGGPRDHVAMEKARSIAMEE